MRMLYVEDNRINALLFEQIAQLRPNVELRVAEDGRSAIEAARDWQPEVLVLDAHLPDMDGFELLPRLRALPGLAAVPAFMCSADARPEDLRRASAAGFSGYWAKPITVARVLADLDALAAAPGAA
jgi:CheY-like chemotaxis protein